MPLIVGSMFLPALETFWSGNRLWSIGSLFVCISVLHSRFFDIRRSASPYNQRIDQSSLVGRWRTLERIAAHLWFVGFLLIAASRWIHY